MPSPTEERRKEIVKHLHKVLENHRTAVRNIRRDIKEAIDKLEKDKKISQDEHNERLKRWKRFHIRKRRRLKISPPPRRRKSSNSGSFPFARPWPPRCPFPLQKRVLESHNSCAPNY